jgi:cell wall-associated NlpC family hydrolase
VAEVGQKRTTFRMVATVSTGLALAVGGAGIAAATTGAATTKVNIRSGPGTSYAVKATLDRGQRVTVTDRAGRGWVKVQFSGSRAYIAAKYVDTKGALPAVPARISTSGTKVATETLNVRSGPSTRYRVVGSVRAGSRISLTGKQKTGFAQTRYAGKLRWVSVAYLATARGSAGTRPSVPSTSAAKGRAALAFAKRQLGKPYVFGAEGPNSYDCSGLMQTAWRTVGVSMPRVARQQYAQGKKISRSQLRAGDLVFFYSQRPSHVGMYAGNGMMIDAPRPGLRVRYTSISRMPYAGAVRPG